MLPTRLPMTVVSGFLGTGTTSLLNHILAPRGAIANPHDQRSLAAVLTEQIKFADLVDLKRQALDKQQQEPYGERINDVAFIGQNTDRTAIKQARARLAYPFPSWDPSTEEQTV